MVVNLLDAGHGHELDVRGLGLARAEALQVGDEEGDAVDELVARERLDGHEDEISPEHRARQALDQRGDEERHRHEQALNQVGHALLEHDVARAGLKFDPDRRP